MTDSPSAISSATSESTTRQTARATPTALEDNRSQNCGVEGETEDAKILARRRTVATSLMATLFVAQGVPLLEMGDELWRTQRGNNNAYCHDSDLTWLDWRRDDDGRGMRDIAAALISLRKRVSAFRQPDFLRGAPTHEADKDITWLKTDGAEMQLGDWQEPPKVTLAFSLAGAPAALVLMNAELERVEFRLPRPPAGETWRIVLETEDSKRRGTPGARRAADTALDVGPGSLVVLIAAAAVDGS